MLEEPQEVIQARADSLADTLADMKEELVRLREKRMRQQDVAELLGMSQAAVSQFERYDANPTMSSLRRYALAVGARLDIRVIDDVHPSGAATHVAPFPATR